MMHDGNNFTDFFERLIEMSRWDCAYKGDAPLYRNKDIVKKKRVFLFFHKTVVETVSVLDDKEDIKGKKISDLIDTYSFLFPITSYKKNGVEAFVKDYISFKTLWDFCDFVKLAEYVIFYPNAPEMDLFVDAPHYQFKKYKEDESKSIRIKGNENFDLTIILEKVEEPYSSNVMNTIKIVIERKSGGYRETIICMDEIHDDTIDRKDAILLENLSDFICEMCYNVFKDITNSIIAESGVKLE